MREVKFRGWHKGLNKWVYGFLTRNKNGVYFIENADSSYGIADDESVGQYTGLKDKHGMEIYEGDIVEYNDFNSLRTGGHAEDKIIVGKVAFSCGMWMVEAKNCGHDLYEGLVNDEELEIIGNVYEHQELLEETA
ncbi:YopX family protein [Lysinibacillus fusiformis]|uniref:YopX family protein n=1 Tax=Lysinibacillus fusiformis TaxID=28031 RepID=UPI00263A61AB|nr:YopX family protein [Lysinibacillus fusiformis]MDC6268037.1 YopX family protein [Lysinibacillus sphaericus]MDN4967473.1 YopX family protein [Lysinibacillus fusiformis]